MPRSGNEGRGLGLRRGNRSLGNRVNWFAPRLSLVSRSISGTILTIPNTRRRILSVYPNVWHHGDFIEITEHGGVKIYGRSDATFNPSGVRIGTAEIYRQVESFPEISDSIVVGQQWDNDVRVILFVKTAANVELTEDLITRIKKAIRENTTPRHVPALILPVADIPCTLNGKKVELAVRNVLEGRPVTNKDALANPEALDLYSNIPELRK